MMTFSELSNTELDTILIIDIMSKEDI